VPELRGAVVSSADTAQQECMPVTQGQHQSKCWTTLSTSGALCACQVLLDDLDIRDLKDAALPQALGTVLTPSDKKGSGVQAPRGGVRVATIDNYQVRSDSARHTPPHANYHRLSIQELCACCLL
jgi:hypothetical protein